VNCTNCSFINCRTNNFAGAICISRDDNSENKPRGKLLHFVRCIFGSNQAAYDGGAILNLQADLKCEKCSFLFNQAGKSGGAIACEFYGTLTFSDCVFVQNLVTDSDCGAQGKGGAIMLWYWYEGPTEMKFENCLFYENLLNASNCLGLLDEIMMFLFVILPRKWE
jgi:predicted outer membrane repeat protein